MDSYLTILYFAMNMALWWNKRSSTNGGLFSAHSARGLGMKCKIVGKMVVKRYGFKRGMW